MAMQAATAVLRVLPSTHQLWLDGRQQGMPADQAQQALHSAAQCHVVWASATVFSAQCTLAHAPSLPPGSPEQQAEAVAAVRQLLVSSCRLIHWLAGLAGSQPEWVQHVQQPLGGAGGACTFLAMLVSQYRVVMPAWRSLEGTAADLDRWAGAGTRAGWGPLVPAALPLMPAHAATLVACTAVNLPHCPSFLHATAACHYVQGVAGP